MRVEVMIYLLVGSLLLNLILVLVLLNHWQNLKENTRQIDRISEDVSQMEVRTRSKFPGFSKHNQAINHLIAHVRGIKARHAKSTSQHMKIISSISHDFRTPITSILGYIQILRDNPTGDRAQEYFDIIEERVASLNKLVNEFYMISLLDSDAYEIDYQLGNPLLFTQERLALYYQELDQVFDQMTIHIDEDPIQVMMAPNDFERIVDNIIRNAYLHGEHQLEIIGKVLDSQIVISFTNQTSNLDEIDIDQLFDRLYKADSARSNQSTGLGLSIAKELSEKMGYSLVATKEDQALKFTLSIPLTQGGVVRG